MFSVAQSVGLVNKTVSMTEDMTEDRARLTKDTKDLEEQVGSTLEGLAKKVASTHKIWPVTTTETR
jgi:hypothetical protein